MKKRELLVKSREAMLSAVQAYNNPLISFKSENYIILAIVSWTYLLHCYYANQNVDYRYWHKEGQRKRYDKTKHGAYKHWELEKCINDKKSPLDVETAQNLRFLIGLRHEIEHQMTQNIDDTVSAKVQACSINYNYYLKKLFGSEYGIDGQLGLAIQFSPINPNQKQQLFNTEKVSDNVCSFISEFEERLTDDIAMSPHYAYRVLFTRLNAKREGQADQVIKFIPEGSDAADSLNKAYMLIKETEKKKYLSKDIVALMVDKGYSWFTVGAMTNYWKNTLKSRDAFGVYITKSQWMWYENWLPIIEKYCQEESKRKSELTQGQVVLSAKDVVKIMVDKGFKKFSKYWLEGLWKYDMKMNRDQTTHGFFDNNHRFFWFESIIPLAEEYCRKNNLY